jgi:hypothetical protein
MHAHVCLCAEPVDYESRQAEYAAPDNASSSNNSFGIRYANAADAAVSEDGFAYLPES